MQHLCSLEHVSTKGTCFLKVMLAEFRSQRDVVHRSPVLLGICPQCGLACFILDVQQLSWPKHFAQAADAPSIGYVAETHDSGTKRFGFVLFPQAQIAAP